MPRGRDAKPQVHRRPKALRVLEPDHAQESQLGGLPPFVPAGWVPRLDVPATRADCPKDRARIPCRHVRCRHHLWLVEGRERPGRRTAQAQRGDGSGQFAPGPPTGTPIELQSILRIASPESCGLDVIERNPDGLKYKEIGPLLGLCGERVRQICVENEDKIRPLIEAAIGGER